MDLWDPLLINSLAGYRRIYLVDMPGTGQGTRPLATIIDTWATQIENFLQVMGLNDVDLFGFAIGGLAVQ